MMFTIGSTSIALLSSQTIKIISVSLLCFPTFAVIPSPPQVVEISNRIRGLKHGSQISVTSLQNVSHHLLEPSSVLPPRQLRGLGKRKSLKHHQASDDDNSRVAMILKDSLSQETSNAYTSPVSDMLLRCASQCNDGSSIALTSKNNVNPSCCKHGVSSLRMKYHGTEVAQFFFLGDPLLEAYAPIDPCSVKATTYGNPSFNKITTNFLRFGTCRRCFPSTNTYCDPQDLSTSVLVEPGDHICLVSVNETGNIIHGAKFPKELPLVFVPQHRDDLLFTTNLHTSCSRPIYPPYGVKIDTCQDAEDFYLVVDNSTMPSVPILEFIDGATSKSPETSFLTCGSLPQNNDQCCKGGASYLKLSPQSLENLSSDAILTLSLSQALSGFACDTSSSKGQGKKSSNKTTQRPQQSQIHPNTLCFVPCSCLENPILIQCNSCSDSISLDEGTEICIASIEWSEGNFNVDLATKLPTNIPLYIIDSNTHEPLASVLHTSCSKPLRRPFGIEFRLGGCDIDDNYFIEVSSAAPSSPTVRMEFLDGISTQYFHVIAAGEKDVSVTFANCGCACENPSCTPAPTTAQHDMPLLSTPTTPPTTGRPSAVPSQLQTILPTLSAFENPTTSPSDEPDSNSASPTLTTLINPSQLTVPVLSPQPTSSQTQFPSDFHTHAPVVTALEFDETDSPSLPRQKATGFEPVSNPNTNNCALQCETWVASNCDLAGDSDTLLPLECQQRGLGGRRTSQEMIAFHFMAINHLQNDLEATMTPVVKYP